MLLRTYKISNEAIDNIREWMGNPITKDNYDVGDRIIARYMAPWKGNYSGTVRQGLNQGIYGIDCDEGSLQYPTEHIAILGLTISEKHKRGIPDAKLKGCLIQIKDTEIFTPDIKDVKLEQVHDDNAAEGNISQNDRKEEVRFEFKSIENLIINGLDKDQWLEAVLKKTFRSEKEVENKFVLHLLSFLGYKEDDRYDGKSVVVTLGKRRTTIITDFVLYNSESNSLKDQALLVVEAKCEDSLNRSIKIEHAQMQVNSYAFHLDCYFSLLTDSKIIQISELHTGRKNTFQCKREELKKNFARIYDLVSKESLTCYYEKVLKDERNYKNKLI